ncbi:MAG TPA: alpha/beta hydrolase [Pseudonocardiaceae bacterium]|nr:alpha/beta hydrolase [Pseudonocardiaceae bacterium]
MGRIRVPGCELIYDDLGTGEPLVLVHGTGAQASTWRGAAGDLAVGGYRVIAYDRRGYGRSTHRPVRDYRIHVADLAAVIEHVGAPAHVLGWSSGGNTALALAVERPELYRCLVIVEAPWHGLRGFTPDLVATLGRVKFSQLRGRRRQGAAIFFRWVSGLRDGGNGFDRLPVAEQEVLLANYRPVLQELDPHPFGVMMEHIPTKRVAAIRVPIRWLLGVDTRSEWFRKAHADVVRVAPSIRTEHITGAGHFAHLDMPTEFAATVLRAVQPDRSDI